MTTRDTEAVTALYRASRRGDTEAITAPLDVGADPNASDSEGFTPLRWAARKGHTEAITALLGAGADPDARSAEGDPAGKLILSMNRNARLEGELRHALATLNAGA